MLLARHPRVMARGTRTDAVPRERVIIYSPSSVRMRFLEGELERDTVLTCARSVSSIIGALVEDPAPVPQILVIDLDSMPPVELLELHAIRHRGWCGTIVGLGHVPPALAMSLGVERVLAFPIAGDALRDMVAGIRFDAKTTRLPVVSSDAELVEPSSR